MRKIVEESHSPLSTLLEWLVTIVIIIYIVKLILNYLYQHLPIVIGLGILIVGSYIAYRIWDYKKRSRY